MVFYQEHNSVGNYSYNIYTYNNYSYALHFHKNFEFFYGIKGDTAIEINGISGVLHEGEFAVALPNQLHSFSADNNSKVWIGVFSEDFIKEFAKTTSKKEGIKLSFRCTDCELDYLKESLFKKSKESILSLKASLYMICNRFLHEIPLRDSNDEAMGTAHSIIKYVEENFNTNISLQDISQLLGYEYHYLSRLFKKTFHTSFPSFLNQYRFEHARYLLMSSNKSISDIAFECGFGSIRNFNRIYKQLSGITPYEEMSKNLTR